MTRIQTNASCGNSPKNQLLVDFLIAIARADKSAVAALVTEDVVWSPVGGKSVNGAAAFCKTITRHGAAARLSVEHVVTHGRAGAIDGIVEFGEKRRAYCYIVDFANAKGSAVKRLTSFSLPVATGWPL